MPASSLLMPEARKAAELYAQGYSMEQTAAKIGRSRKVVATGLKHMGVKTRPLTEGAALWRKRKDAP